jgi:hypothetical protein
MLVLAILTLAGCNRAEVGSPEAVADAFCDAYFREADQEKAKQFTAFGATKMLDAEIREVRSLRESGYTPRDASLEVAISRGERKTREDRVRFDYVLRYEEQTGEVVKHADIELAKVHDEWKVVRIGLSGSEEPEHKPGT